MSVTVFAVFLGLLSWSSSWAEDISFFRIGTGSTGGTYFPVGGILANAISNPPGSRACNRGGSCGVPGLIAVAQSTEGSVENVKQLGAGLLDSGFSQADVSFWAYRGEGLFKEQGGIPGLRAIANLFPESVHLVVRRNSGIRSVRDLKGLRISIDLEGSGTQVDALLILEAYGIGVEDFDAVSVPSGIAADMLRAEELDGFFIVAGTPVNAVKFLAADSLVTLVPIAGKEAETLRQAYPFFAQETVAAGTYFNVPATRTLSVGAQWLVTDAADEELIYQVTRALWHENTRKMLMRGHPKGRLITIDTAISGLGVPLHDGARRYYREIGVIE
ncbi:TAXI family TRAP transporter solute-binding subunit [Denitrobaculum tricleocarpae]|uniref:TAXI family TRAP transporter solute-binding subunit n=1 Tax=Denitrobaculum tricleocarpae TaxID=2591009 RepID=A0A545U1C5_9PROT|nr:TAXI family TRAP transporter solute-binding subunit [Denitrobaculum tricleocarpae]